METAVIRERLTHARDQYHKLMMGKATRVLVDQNGERIEYTAVSADGLRGYIQELEAMLVGRTGGRRFPGPLRFRW